MTRITISRLQYAASSSAPFNVVTISQITASFDRHSMKSNLFITFWQTALSIFAYVSRIFDRVTTWVIELSWWKFTLFAILMMTAVGILEHSSESDPAVHVTVKINKNDSKIPKSPTNEGIQIDHNGASLADSNDNNETADQVQSHIISSQTKSSTRLMDFVLLLILGLFGTKVLMGGKKRAEAQARIANAAAEHANLQRELSEAKIQMIQAQVEPHFLFNTLASVQYLIETDPPRASAMQQRLIQYLRAVLPQIRETTAVTTLGREIDIVRSYLDLLKMRMEERLHVNFQISDGLRSAIFPPMMLQLLVENAIKHGLECKVEGGTLHIMAEVADSQLRISVIDDGLGFATAPSNSTGLGLQSIRDRLKLLHGAAAQLAIAPNNPCGVCATIEVPYQVIRPNNAQSA